MSTRTSRAISGTLTSCLQFGLQLGLQAVLAPLVLRVTGQETLGAYAVLMQAIEYLALVDLGFGVALGRYLAQACGYEDGRRRFRDVFRTGRTFYLASNTVFGILLVGFSAYAGTLFSLSSSVEHQARIGLWILAAWSVVRTPLAVYSGALIATQNLAAANLISISGNAVRLLSALGLVMMGMGLIGLMLANVLAEVVTFVLQRWYYSRLYPDDRFGWGIPDSRLFREMIRFSAGFLLVIIGGRLALSTDALVVGKLFGGAAASVYYTTQMPTFLLVALIWKIADNAAPALNELHGRQAIVPLQRAYLRLLRYSLLLAVGLALGLLAFNRMLITLWVGEAQYAGRVMTVALALYCIGAAANHVNALVLMVHGTMRCLSIWSIAGGVANLILSVCLGKVIGLQGVMVATTVVDAVGLVILGSYGLRLFKVTFLEAWREAIAPALVANLFALPIFALAHLWQGTATWPWLLIWTSAFVLAWTVGTAAAGLTKADFGLLRDYFGRAIAAMRD